ncbi:MAG: V-type ATPase subunit [Candidatus Thermoplasmatota archaeon]|nr:V-type ATPase subunit [Candidatus Thermoplasmatota archaeon]
MFEQLLSPTSLEFWLLIILVITAVIVVVGRYFTTYVKFIYPNAKFEAIGNPFLLEKELRSLIETKNLSIFIDRVNLLRDYHISGGDANSIQRSLDEHLTHTIEMMRTDSSKKLEGFYDLHLEKYDLPLIKNQLKSILFGVKVLPAEHVPLTKLRTFLHELQTTTKETITDQLRSYGFDEDLIEDFEKNKQHSLSLDILFDKYILRQFQHLKVPYKCEQLKQDYIKSLIDMLTIQYLLRAKHLHYPAETCTQMFLGEGKEIAPWRFKELAEAPDVPQAVAALDGTSYFPLLNSAVDRYNNEKSSQVFDSGIKTTFLKRIKDLSLQNYLTLGPTVRFLVSKEFEIQNLKIIAKGLSEHLPSDFIYSHVTKETAS